MVDVALIEILLLWIRAKTAVNRHEHIVVCCGLHEVKKGVQRIEGDVLDLAVRIDNCDQRQLSLVFAFLPRCIRAKPARSRRRRRCTNRLVDELAGKIPC